MGTSDRDLHTPSQSPDRPRLALERDGMAWPPSEHELAEWRAQIDAGSWREAQPPAAFSTSSDAGGGLRALAREVLETVALAALHTIGMHLVVQAREVLGSSMEPTLHTGQRVLVSRVSYGPFGAPQRGHIVVFNSWGDDKDYIKRIVGLPGDTIEIRDGRVYVNDVVLDEPYLERVAAGTYGPVQLEPDEYYVLGDNRVNSADSRYYGPLPAERIIGRAWLSVWPPADFGSLQY